MPWCEGRCGGRLQTRAPGEALVVGLGLLLLGALVGLFWAWLAWLGEGWPHSPLVTHHQQVALKADRQRHMLLGAAGVAAAHVALALVLLQPMDMAGNMVLMGSVRPTQVGGASSFWRRDRRMWG